MSTIATPLAAGAAGAASLKPRSGETDDDGSFSIVYDSLAGGEAAKDDLPGDRSTTRKADKPARDAGLQTRPSPSRAADDSSENVRDGSATAQSASDPAIALALLLDVGAQADAPQTPARADSRGARAAPATQQDDGERAADATTGQKAARVTIIGRETHFAPVLGAPLHRGETASGPSLNSQAVPAGGTSPVTDGENGGGATAADQADIPAERLPDARVSARLSALISSARLSSTGMSSASVFSAARQAPDASSLPVSADADARVSAQLSTLISSAGVSSTGTSSPARQAPGISSPAASPDADALPISIENAGSPDTKSADTKLVDARLVSAGTSDVSSPDAPALAGASKAAVNVGGVDSVSGALSGAVEQIVAQARELAGLSAPAAAAAPANVARSTPAFTAVQDGGPVRILRLQLQPEELGLVTARLRIVGGVLEVRLTADRQQSVEALRRDQEGLLETLRRAGYKAEIASIDFARPHTPAPSLSSQPTAQTAGQAAGQPMAQDGNGGTNLAGGDGRQERETADRQASERETDDAHAEARLRTGHDADAVYL
ncbi:MAG: flagellar hook-length control protein FliK [Pseudochelatococcus sp.]|jgi:hypothetical protein|uniref:flagellar hook-length control protein FliK n=1 Tax=Pseudochelatococcus sp. TaxID=2020869 RepID=UPI003D8F1CCD